MRRDLDRTMAPRPGYIDGGTASMVFQLALAGILVATFTVKSFWLRVKAALTQLFRRRTNGDEQG